MNSSTSKAADLLAVLPFPPPLERSQALFLDFDGTLVEIAPTPARVQVMRDLPTLLAAVAGRLDGAVAVVSGRSVDDLARLLHPFRGPLAGLHGLERRARDGVVSRPEPDGVLARARALLADFAAVRPALLLEDKGAALALHYRQAPDLAGACREAATHAAALGDGGLTVVEGKMVVELRLSSADKGAAIAALHDEPPFAGRVPVFVGDDRTDEDGFAVVNGRGGISIAVGNNGETCARYRIDSVGNVLSWLEARLDQPPGLASATEASR